MTADGTVMPNQVIGWMKKHPERECDEKVFKAYAEVHRDRETMMCAPAPKQMQTWFPQLACIDLCRLEKALQHSFSNRMLLAEALQMTSGKSESMTPDFQRLAFVGNTVAEQLITRILVESAQFSTAATLSHHDKPAKANTFAVGPNASLQTIDNKPKYEWPATGGRVDNAERPDLHLSSPDKLRKVLNACCNNVAYARTCVELGLHKGMQGGTPELTRSVQSFAKAVERFNQEKLEGENPWPRLLRHDAPRALGNTFVACLGAIVMDGAPAVQENPILDARKVLLEHVFNCQDMPISAKTCVQNETPHLSWETLTSLVKDAGNTLFARVLSPPTPASSGSLDPTPVRTATPTTEEEEQVRVALDLTDVHCHMVDDVLTYARSPRSAVLRAPYLSLERDLYDEEDDETLEEAGESNGGAPEGGAKYCEDCEKWVNVPTQ